MAKKKQSVPEYGTVTRKGTLYYRTRITDADGKQVSLYATTCEELYEKQLEGPETGGGNHLSPEASDGCRVL